MMLKDEIIERINAIPNCKTKDADAIINDIIKRKVDVEELLPYIMEYPVLHRCYFKTSLKKCKTIDEQLDFVENHFDYLADWWHTDQLLQFLKKPIDFNMLYKRCSKYVISKQTFTRRWGYVLFLCGAQKNPANFKKIVSLYHDDSEYYVCMAEAWLLADLCIASPEDTLKFIETSGLKYDILGKAIQKICDSFRISDDIKTRAKSLRRLLINN